MIKKINDPLDRQVPERIDVSEYNTFLDLSSSIRGKSHAPRKLEISRNNEFREIQKKIVERSLCLKLPHKKTPDAFLILALEATEGIIRPGFIGNMRVSFTEKLNRLFGEKNWSFMHKIQTTLLEPSYAYQHYTDAYIEYFKTHPKVLAWVTNKFSNVIDTAESNIDSGLDFNKQESPEKGVHIHDIAIRKAVHELGKTFKGSEILKVRGPRTNGFFLSPGRIKFHLPELIPNFKFPDNVWWCEGSIEDFYQKTRFLVVDEFTSDSRNPINTKACQSRESYLHRVAARSLVRMLPYVIQPDSTLSEVQELPWMIDYNTFPIGEDGLTREFTNKETLTILNSFNVQLQSLFKKTGIEKKDIALLGEMQFKVARKSLNVINKIFSGNEKELVPNEITENPEVYEMESWREVLKYFWDEIRNKDAHPIFLARDGLAIMEYCKYRDKLIGDENSIHFNDLHSMYLPGTNFGARGGKNRRSKNLPIENIVTKLFQIKFECFKELNLTKPPSTENEKKDLANLFEEKIINEFKIWKEGRNVTVGVSTYDFWEGVFDEMKEQLQDKRNVLILDTDGTGKTALFIKTFLEYFSKEVGNPIQASVVLGGVQKKHLGVKNILEEKGLSENGITGTLLPDVRWPFNFTDFKGEPIFKYQRRPKALLTNFFRSISFYNTATRDFKESLKRRQNESLKM